MWLPRKARPTLQSDPHIRRGVTRQAAWLVVGDVCVTQDEDMALGGLTPVVERYRCRQALMESPGGTDLGAKERPRRLDEDIEPEHLA